MKKYFVLCMLVMSALQAEELSSLVTYTQLLLPKTEESSEAEVAACCRTRKSKQDARAASQDAPKMAQRANYDSIFEVGGSYSYLWLKPEGDNTFEGSLGGAQAIYEYKPKNFLYQGLKFSWRQGSTKVDDSSRFILDFDAQERIGYTISRCNHDWKATLFTGFGYRYLGQNLKQPALENLRFGYNEFYVPVGFLVGGPVSSSVKLGINVTWMPQAFPTLALDPLHGAYWTLDRKYVNFSFEAPISYVLTKSKDLAIQFKPFFQYWEDGRTTAVAPNGVSLSIPQNTYLFAGAEVNLDWMF